MVSVVAATLEYDSARDPVCGTRGFGLQPRMLLFKWNGMTVDVMIWSRGKRACSVHGQVTRGSMRTPVVGVEVSTRDTGVVTNHFGEFAVALRPELHPGEVRVRWTEAEVVCSIPTEDAPHRWS